MTITETNYVTQAEQVIRSLITVDKYGNQKLALTTSKIRNILSMSATLYNDVQHMKADTLDEETQGRVQYLRMRIAYEAGREQKTVKPFVEKAELLNILEQVGNDKKRLLLFCRYMEALVAYHRFYGGND